MNAPSQREELSGPRRQVRCMNCRAMIFDGVVVKSRVVRVAPAGSCEAKCAQCKDWVRVPLRYCP